MNTEIVLQFLIISLIGIFLFWLMYRKANNTNAQAQKYLLSVLQDTSLSSGDKQKYQDQLSQLLQQNKGEKTLLITTIIGVILIVSSFALYNKLGTPDVVEKIKTANQEQKQQQAQAPQMSMEDAIAQLEAKLNENPNDLEGQLLFARSQVSIKNYKKAVAAYRKANELSPNDANILTVLAESIAMFNNNRSFLGEPEGLLERAVQIDPLNQKALWLYGMVFYEKKEYVKTNEIWSKLYSMLSDEGAKNQLMQQLKGVKQKLGDNEVKDIGDVMPMEVDTVKLKLHINVEEKLLNKLDGKPAMLYIYTKEITGMPMPIAVIKRNLNQVKKIFPVTLELSDKNNLQTSRKLSSFDNVKVGARISFTGNAMPQTGDLQSDEVDVVVSDDGITRLIINKVR